MRIRISHETVYSYDPPATGVIQILRLTPRNHDGQYVVHWRLDVSHDYRLDQHEDAFGNITHSFSAAGPLEALKVRVEGELETQDTAGIVHGAVERFPPSLYLRDSRLARADPAIALFAAEAREETGDDKLALLHELMRRLHGALVFDTDPTHAATSAPEAFGLGRGVCQDFSHIFIAACRTLGVPARYVSGHLRRSDGEEAQSAGHAWVEAHVPDLGWVAFDPTNGVSATDAYVRVAVGLDYLDAAPVRGTRFGGGSETLQVKVNVDQAQWQAQD
ncbi:MAG TPA: transglutaminase family protein [Xanthobacteraceae bacterium]|jgi:transglutaminase-like putative cysteine protease